MSAQDNAAIARTIYEAFNNHEFDRALEYVSDDAEVELYAFGLSFTGREGFRQMMQFHKTPWPDGTVEVLQQTVGEDAVTNECLYRATHTAPMPTSDGNEIPPTGRSVELRFCEVWRFSDGKVVSLHNYADNMSVMQQLGLIPQPEMAVS